MAKHVLSEAPLSGHYILSQNDEGLPNATVLGASGGLSLSTAPGLTVLSTQGNLGTLDAYGSSGLVAFSPSRATFLPVEIGSPDGSVGVVVSTTGLNASLNLTVIDHMSSQNLDVIVNQDIQNSPASFVGSVKSIKFQSTEFMSFYHDYDAASGQLVLSAGLGVPAPNTQNTFLLASAPVDDSLPHAVNLGLLGSGLLKQTSSSGVSVPAIASPATPTQDGDYTEGRKGLAQIGALTPSVGAIICGAQGDDVAIWNAFPSPEASGVFVFNKFNIDAPKNEYVTVPHNTRAFFGSNGVSGFAFYNNDKLLDLQEQSFDVGTLAIGSTGGKLRPLPQPHGPSGLFVLTNDSLGNVGWHEGQPIREPALICGPQNYGPVRLSNLHSETPFLMKVTPHGVDANVDVSVAVPSALLVGGDYVPGSKTLMQMSNFFEVDHQGEIENVTPWVGAIPYTTFQEIHGTDQLVWKQAAAVPYDADLPSATLSCLGMKGIGRPELFWGMRSVITGYRARGPVLDLNNIFASSHGGMMKCVTNDPAYEDEGIIKRAIPSTITEDGDYTPGSKYLAKINDISANAIKGAVMVFDDTNHNWVLVNPQWPRAGRSYLCLRDDGTVAWEPLPTEPEPEPTKPETKKRKKS